MKKIDYADFLKTIEAGYERRDLEFKSAFTWKKSKEMDYLQACTIKAIISLSNLKNGGLLIVGIKQKGSEFELQGLNKEEYCSFNNYEIIRESINSFVYLSVNFDMEYALNEKGKYFIVFRVTEFEETPLIVKKKLKINEHVILEEDIIYTRTKHSLSSDKAKYIELKELMDHYSDKRMREFKNRMKYIDSNDEDLFKAQQQGLTYE